MLSQAIIVDDEPLLRFHLQKSLAETWPELEILAQASNGEEAWALISELKPQVVFLDIHMPGMSGLEVAEKCTQLTNPPHVVFLTAYDEHAVEAFERGAVDYLLKPLDENRLAKTVERIQNLKSYDQEESSLEQVIKALQRPTDEPYLQWINAAKGEQIHVVSVDDVHYFKAEDKYTTLVCEQGELLLRTSIKQLQEQLNPKFFWRIHRGTMINMRFVDKVQRNLSGHLQVAMKGHPNSLAVSRAYSHLFKQH